MGSKILIKALLFNDTSLAGHHGCTLVINQILELAQKNGISVVERLSSKTPLDKRHAANIDIIIVNGEGSLHNSSNSAIAMADTFNWSHKNNIPCFLINSIFQDNNDYINNAIQLANLVYLRDCESLKSAQSLGLSAQYVPDLTLSWHPKLERQSGDLLTVTDSTLKCVDEALFRWSHAHNFTHYLPLKARPSRSKPYSMNNLQRRLKFFSKRHLTSHFSSRFYAARYRNCIPEFDSFVEQLSRSRLILAGRFHAICLAIDLEIPFCAVTSNSWKVENLLKEVGLEDRLVTVDQIENTSPERLIQRYGRFSVEETVAIRSFKKSTKVIASEMFANIYEEAKRQKKSRVK